MPGAFRRETWQQAVFKLDGAKVSDVFNQNQISPENPEYYAGFPLNFPVCCEAFPFPFSLETEKYYCVNVTSPAYNLTGIKKLRS